MRTHAGQFAPQTTLTTLADGATLTPDGTFMRLDVTDSITLNATTAIADGREDGQLLILLGNGAGSGSVTVNNSANTSLGGNRQIDTGVMLMLIWDAQSGLWRQLVFTGS
jgi:hypothetical protein